MSSTAQFTIVSQSGQATCSLPDDAKAVVAYLYFGEDAAIDAISHFDKPENWQTKQVDDVERWLESLQRDGITHVYEQLPGTSTIHPVDFWLTSLRALRLGREYHDGRGSSIVVDPS